MTRLLVALALSVPSVCGMGTYTPENAACTKLWQWFEEGWEEPESCQVPFTKWPTDCDVAGSCCPCRVIGACPTDGPFPMPSAIKACRVEQDCQDLTELVVAGTVEFETKFPLVDKVVADSFCETIQACLGTPVCLPALE